jgi:putative ABC transport system permease protein
LKGRRERLRITGVALSPEFVYVLPPGQIAVDNRTAGVLWMTREAMAPAFGMEGAFDDVTLGLRRGTAVPAVLREVDRILEPYGGLGAVGRDRQASARLLRQELDQLRTMATVLPVLFLAVAGFLVSVVLGRVIAIQREQIAALKALGYANREVGLHYLGLVFTFVAPGIALGVLLGDWLGGAMTRLYSDYFHFPALEHRLEPSFVLLAVFVTAAAAIAGSLRSVRAVARLPPAEAMRPEAPARYDVGIVERAGLLAALPAAGRMVARDLLRRPLRALLAATAIALAIAILITGRFSMDALDWMLDLQFRRAQRQDLTLSFSRPMPTNVRARLRSLPGVRQVELERAVAVRARVGHRSREVVIQGLEPGAVLHHVYDLVGREVRIPPNGIVLSGYDAGRLGIRAGASIRLEPLEGERRPRTAIVVALVDELIGVSAYARAETVSRLLGEEPVATGALLTVDPSRAAAVAADLRRFPNVAGVLRKDASLRLFREQTSQVMGVYTLFLVAFASAIAIGVVYNGARVALSTRGRDLATLRVLGFTQGEAFAVLLGEQIVHVALAIPIGFGLGRVMAEGIAAATDPELYRFPAIVSPKTYAFAASVVLATTVVSALLVRGRVRRLDLLAVLKARD